MKSKHHLVVALMDAGYDLSNAEAVADTAWGHNEGINALMYITQRRDEAKKELDSAKVRYEAFDLVTKRWENGHE